MGPLNLFKPGTLPWLMAHEWKLSWRQVIAKKSTLVWWLIIVVLGLILCLPLLALPWILNIILERQGISLTPATLPITAHWAAVVIWISLFLLSLFSIVGESFQSLFGRGDLDLLLASPISPKVVLASRLLDPAYQYFVTYGLLVGLPVSLIGFTLGFPQLLGIYPALVGLSLTSASLAVLLTLGLVRRLGVKRTHTLIKVVITLLGGGSYAAFQFHNLQGSSGISQPSIGGFWQPWFAAEDWLGVHSWIWFPVRAMFGDISSILLTLVFSIGLTWLTIELMHRDFLSGTQQTFTHKSKRRLQPKRFTFAGDLGWVILRKEWRTILRNPELISTLSVQILYLVPVMVLLNRWGGTVGLTTAVAIAAPLIGGGLATPLINIAVIAEESPNLLRSAPIQSAQLLRLKILAALLPIWLLSIPCFVFLMLRGQDWLVPLVIFLAATTCDAVLTVWSVFPNPANRVFERREDTRKRSWIIVGLFSLQAYLWPLLGYLATQGMWIGSLVCLLVIAAIFGLAYWRSRQLATTVGF